MRRFFLFFLFLLFFLLASCKATDFLSGLSSKFLGEKFPAKQITLETSKGKFQLTVEIADNEKRRSRGLMERKKLDEGRGMWFIFSDEALRIFWMRNTLIPLDIIFFDSEKKVVSFVENMEPCLPALAKDGKVFQCPSYVSQEKAMFALEVPAGFVRENRVEVGDRVILEK